jgi:hypothetical protein
MIENFRVENNIEDEIINMTVADIRIATVLSYRILFYLLLHISLYDVAQGDIISSRSISLIEYNSIYCGPRFSICSKIFYQKSTEAQSVPN